MAVTTIAHDPYLALRHRDYRFFIVARFLASMGVLMQDVAVGWQLYERTHSTLALGLTGLVSVTPTILFALPAGALADRVDRRNVARLGRILAGIMSVWLAVLSATHGPVWMIYAALFVGGVGFAFVAPAQSALISQVLPGEAFANGVTWNATAFQIAATTGPAVAGAMIGITGSATIVYVTGAAMAATYIVLLSVVRTREQRMDREPITRKSLAAGLRFVFSEELLLAAITLDLFAVLFGGATTLLPVYAKDILHVGPAGLGWLRASPSVGAMLTALWIAHRGPMKRAGTLLLSAVFGFGVSTIVFGISHSFALSMIGLFLIGGFDAVSVVIRSSLLQLRTPDALRGRVNAVNGIFVDLSNELGGFESGAIASLVGPIVTVVAGGLGTIIVVIVAGAKWKSLRELDDLSTPLE